LFYFGIFNFFIWLSECRNKYLILAAAFHGIPVAQFTPDFFRGNHFICISLGICSIRGGCLKFF